MTSSGPLSPLGFYPNRALLPEVSSEALHQRRPGSAGTAAGGEAPITISARWSSWSPDWIWCPPVWLAFPSEEQRWSRNPPRPCRPISSGRNSRPPWRRWRADPADHSLD